METFSTKIANSELNRNDGIKRRGIDSTANLCHPSVSSMRRKRERAYRATEVIAKIENLPGLISASGAFASAVVIKSSFSVVISKAGSILVEFWRRIRDEMIKSSFR